MRLGAIMISIRGGLQGPPWEIGLTIVRLDLNTTLHHPQIPQPPAQNLPTDLVYLSTTQSLQHNTKPRKLKEGLKTMKKGQTSFLGGVDQSLNRNNLCNIFVKYLENKWKILLQYRICLSEQYVYNIWTIFQYYSDNIWTMF